MLFGELGVVELENVLRSVFSLPPAARVVAAIDLDTEVVWPLTQISKQASRLFDSDTRLALVLSVSGNFDGPSALFSPSTGWTFTLHFECF